MREILFRGKTINKDEWIYSMTISNGTIARKQSKVFMELGEGKWKGVKGETVGQYSGVKDIAGEEVFEGDIIEINGNTFVVKYGENPTTRNIGFYLKNTEHDCISYVFTCVKKGTVIDNIHDMEVIGLKFALSVV